MARKTFKTIVIRDRGYCNGGERLNSNTRGFMDKDVRIYGQRPG